MKYRKKFVVEPGGRLHLDEIDPSFTGKLEHESDAADAIAKDRERLSHLHYRLYAENRRSLLIVLQAMDAGGKDGTIQHVFGALNPQGASVHAFKVPTAEEAAHDFLWRAHKVTPERGRIAIFNRSYYEDVLVARVHGLASKDVVAKRLDRIVEFEKLLAQADTHVVKFYLHISADEQLRRFEQRLDDPQRNWKIDEADFAERPFWNDYRKAYEHALGQTSTDRAPWYVVPANHKWFRNLAVAQIVSDTLDDLDVQSPKPAADVERLRAQLHAAEESAKGRA
ncbi:MAG: polyphosphate kinase 2 family protein [Candidatus Elarobacter sp.]